MNDSSSQFQSRLQARTIQLGNTNLRTRNAINLSERIFQNAKYVYIIMILKKKLSHLGGRSAERNG